LVKFQSDKPNILKYLHKEERINQRMKIHLPKFESIRVLVMGDVMLDRYWHGETSRISPEAPVPVVRVTQQEDRPGGAGNVALNIAALGAKPALYSMCGEDDVADILEHKLTAAGVAVNFQRISGMPTVTKLRVLSLHQQLIRLDFEEPFHQVANHDLLSRCLHQIPTIDAVVLSDYAKGGIQNTQAIIDAANKANVPVLVDPKSKDFSIYQNATIITPNLHEFEAVVGVCDDERMLVEKGFSLLKSLNLRALLITRGSKGMTLLTDKDLVMHLPTEAKDVYDVTGAGDTVIGVLSASIAAGLPFAEATVLANKAAGIVVGKIGAATVSVPELRKQLMRSSTLDRGILDEDRLYALMKDAQRHGERIVFTNGCFDILHSGHVMYLEQAKALGDRLVVAVNDDDSVKRLKGADRPINSLDRRMAVLSGLASVDWVVPFREDTPQRLICHLLPDILVKGGDWQVDQVAGAECVLRAGGEVKILGFEEGISTTNIVKKIRKKS
jgi:D-beta-D-heptose 7-phosphate kinase / D-beta-D-heptose 1-phosphate adenosyltransferase